MNKNPGDFLLISIQNTFRDMAGLEVKGRNRPEKEISYSNVFIIESFHPEKIIMQFFFPLKEKKLMVEHILQENWDNLTNQYIDDCILEVINVIAGNFFCRYFAPDHYDISLPKLTFDDQGLSLNNMYFFETGDIIFAVSLS